MNLPMIVNICCYWIHSFINDYQIFSFLYNSCHISNFGVTTAILNAIVISPRCCKLNFGSLWNHIKSCHFPELIDVRRQYFHFFIQIIWNHWQESLWKTLLENDLALLRFLAWIYISLRLEEHSLDTKNT